LVRNDNFVSVHGEYDMGRSLVGVRNKCWQTLAALGALLGASCAMAAHWDITGPVGSVFFGNNVVALPNGNFVVTDRKFFNYAGAVYLYTADGALVSSLTGSNTMDQVGSTITVLESGNFVVGSPYWNNGTGAATFVDANTGLTGQVSSTNSLVGGTAGDNVGYVTALANGHYVVSVPNWHNSANIGVGAVTWANGTTGLSGTVTAANSLVGATAGDEIGRLVTALPNGNYVVQSPLWHLGSISVGAVTWVDGSGPTAVTVSTSNSLHGSSDGDRLGNYGITILANGNYVVASPNWKNGSVVNAGAATWAQGTAPIIGAVSPANSLVGTQVDDSVGMGIGVVPLSNGNYVVGSRLWDNGSLVDAGAATWANGTTGISGAISVSNSLIGSNSDATVGAWVIALTNGNYVVGSPRWNDGSASVGAATWVDGTTGAVGVITAAHSIVGAAAGDGQYSNAIALSNGNYVVANPSWRNGTASNAGATTWGDGSTGTQLVVSAANSLVGTTVNDKVGNRLVALDNGNYVVVSADWDNGSTVNAGAVTWANGNGGMVGAVSPVNSLIGTDPNDMVGRGRAIALTNGNYVVVSDFWNGGMTRRGAITLANGMTGTTGPISILNSLVGSSSNDLETVEVYPTIDGNYLVHAPRWNDGASLHVGAATFGDGHGGTIGPITDDNSVCGTVAEGGPDMRIAYDPTHSSMIVGQPRANIVTIFTGGIFADGFE